MSELMPTESELQDMDAKDNEYLQSVSGKTDINLVETVDVKTSKDIAKMLGVEPKIDKKENKENADQEEDSEEDKSEDEDKEDEKEEEKTDENTDEEDKNEDAETEDDEEDSEEDKSEDEDKEDEKEDEKEDKEEGNKEEEKKEEKDLTDYRKIEKKLQDDSQYSVLEILNLKKKLDAIKPIELPEDEDSLSVREQVALANKISFQQEKQKGLQERIAEEQERIKNNWGRRISQFESEFTDDVAAMNKFKTWLYNDLVGKNRFWSASMGTESLEDIYDEYNRRLVKTAKKKEEKQVIKKSKDSKFKPREKTKTSVKPQKKKRSKYPLLNDPKYKDTLKGIKSMWNVFHPGEEMTDEKLNHLLEEDGKF